MPVQLLSRSHIELGVCFYSDLLLVLLSDLDIHQLQLKHDMTHNDQFIAMLSYYLCY